MSKLNNKVTVITGGNSGIGLTIAEKFKQQGVEGGSIKDPHRMIL
jgi:NAD(P)-dependent dehydrogenase (short-subunit alcohol dehydrogenase family)